MKALQKTPYELFQLDYKVGDKVTGAVVQKLPFGIIVELAQDVRGLLHRSEYSWNPNDNYDAYVKIGQQVQLVIVSLDIKKEKIGLSRKLLLDNPWKDVTVKRGDIVVAKVTALDKNQIVVNVQGADGIIKNDEISTEKNVKIDDHFVIGQEVEALVIQADRNTWNLVLSIRILKEKQLRDDFEKFMESEQEDQSKTTIGDLFEETLKKRK
jgi:small subunit ribosomal protein S1